MPDYRELGRMLENYQRGLESNQTAAEEDVLNFEDEPNPYPEVSTERFKALKASLPGISHGDVVLNAEGVASVLDRGDGNSASFNLPGMVEAGWGNKPKFDTNSGYYEGMNVEDARARQQSDFWKIGNGALKGSVTAVTTAANTVAGGVVGLGTSLFRLGDQLFTSKKFDIDQVMDGFTNNILTETMMDLQKLSEELFPNYRTEAEQSEQYQREWYKHIMTPNFIGDSFLKNFGFTVGAMIGGAAVSGTLAKMMNMKGANDLLKTAISASKGDAQASAALKEALAILDQSGGAAYTIKGDILLGNLKEAAKTLNKKGAILQLVGATVGAVGEGTTEGVMAKNEFLESYLPKLEQDYATAYDSIEQDVIREHPEWCSGRTGVDEYGRLRDDIPYLSDPDGIAEVERRRNEMTQKYIALRQMAEEQGERLATTTFALNVPLLTLTNTLEFGRMFSGGWKTANRAIRNSGAVNIGKNGISSAIEDATGNLAWNATKKASKVGLTEMSEEMIQGVFSSGSKKVADDRLTAFNDDAYDPETIENFGSWFRSMYQGGSDYLLDIKNWQEGFMGLVTGLVGVPGIRGTAGGRWNGGVYGAISEARSEKNAARSAVNEFNNLVNSEEFQNRWKGWVRHNKYSDQMDEALIAKDQYAWHTADEKMLINDIMLFDDLGRLDELEEIVDNYTNLDSASDQEINEIRKAMYKPEDVEALKPSREQIAKRVTDQAKKMKDAIKEYREIYDEYSARVPVGTSREQLKELVFTAANMKRFEHRFLDMFGDVMHAIEPYLRLEAELEKKEEENGKDSKSAKARSFNELYNQYAAFFTSALPRQIGVFDQMFKRDINIDALKEFVATNKEVEQKVEDMKRLMKDREAFYNKLVRLENLAPGEFEKQAKNNKKAVDQKTSEAVAADISSYETLEDLRNEWSTLSPKEKNKFKKDLDSAKDRPHVKEFLDYRKTVEDFRKHVRDQFSGVLGMSADLGERVVEKLFESSPTRDDFLKFDFLSLSSSELDDVINTSAKSASYTSAQRAMLKSGLIKSLQIMADDYHNGVSSLSEEHAAEIRSAFGDTTPGSFAQSNFTQSANNVVPAGMTTGQAFASRPPVLATSSRVDEEPSSPSAPSAPAPPAVSPQKSFDGKLRRGSAAERASAAGNISNPSAAENLADSKGFTGSKYNYLQTIITEISINDRDKLRAALKIKDPNQKSKALKEIVLHNSKDVDPGIESLWDFLMSNHAFENVIDLNPGDLISLRVLPTVQKEGAPTTILLYNDDKLVGVLPSDTKRYAGLEELRNDVEREYKIWNDNRTGDYFEFSHKTTVWGKARGVLDCRYSPKKGVYMDQPLTPDVDGYDANAPVIAVGAQGELIPLRGDMRDAEAFSQHSTLTGFEPKPGTFYYLTKDGAGGIIPVWLNVEHLTKDVYGKAKENGRVAQIDKWFAGLKDIMRELVDGFNSGNTSEEFIESKNDSLHSHMSELGKYIDINKIFFKFKIGQSGRPVIYTRWDNLSEDKSIEENMKSSKQWSINDEGYIDRAIENILAQLFDARHSFQIDLRHGVETAKKDFEELFSQGYITSNVNSLRPKNVNFYMERWEPGKDGAPGKFVAEPYQEKAEQEFARQQESAAETPVETPAQQEPPLVLPKGLPTLSTSQREYIDDEHLEISDEDNGPSFDFQIVGTRESAPSQPTPDEEELKKKRTAQRIRMETSASPLFKQLQLANSVNMNMSEKKLKEKLKSVGLSTPVINFLVDGIRQQPELKNVTPYEAFLQLTRLMRYDIQKEYNSAIKEKIDRGLEDFLTDFLAKYNIRVKKADLRKAFKREDIDIAGAFDVIGKTIWLSENPEQRNKLTMPEEFAHAFVELMGSSIEYGADSSDFKFLYNTVTSTGLYKQVYDTYKNVYVDTEGNPDEYRIRKEAIGQALAAGIVHNWNEKKLGKTEENKTFWNKLKDWFQKIVDLFKGSNLTFEDTIDNIAKEVLAGDTHRLKKVDDTGYDVLDYESTLENQNKLDGGKALSFLKYFSKAGNIITGSLSYRMQGVVKRGKLDSLHDIDMIVPNDVHGIDYKKLFDKYIGRDRRSPEFANEVLSIPYFKKIKNDYPKIVFANVYQTDDYVTVNAVYSENEELSRRFASLTGSYSDRLARFTEDERKQIYLFDFFLHPKGVSLSPISDTKRELRLSDAAHSFRSKLKMGRAKDVYDYQVWKTYQEYTESGPNPMDLLFQATNPDKQQQAIDKHIEEVSSLFGKERSSEPAVREFSKAFIAAASRGPKAANELRLSLMNWNDQNVSVSNHVEDFHRTVNAILTETEKSDFATAATEIYGVPSAEIDALRMMRDYSEWKYTRTLPNGSDDAKHVIENVFKRLEAIDDSRRVVLSEYPGALKIVGQETNMDDPVPAIGRIYDLGRFTNLPSDVRDMLNKQGISEDDYDNAQPGLQDIMLRCAGV